MRLEALELVGPEGLHLVKPRLQIDKGLRSQPVHPQASILLHRLLRIIDLDPLVSNDKSQDDRCANEKNC